VFTGIVEETGIVEDVVDGEGGRRLRISTDALTDFTHGESISVGGVCLTVEEHGSDWFTAFTATETLEKTSLETVGRATA